MTNQKSPQNNQQSIRPVSLGLKPTFKFLYEFMGKAFATQSKCKAYELENHESEALAQQSDDLMIEFFPNIQSRWVKLVIFIGSLVGIFGKKYLEHMEQEKKKNPEKEVEVETKPDATPQVLDMGNPFPVNHLKRF